GIRLGLSKMMDSIAIANLLGDARPEEIEAVRLASNKERLFDHQVQRGLHALTGRDAKTEQEIREATVRRTELADPAFGLAIHPFGDSFAHSIRGGSRMHSCGAGHFVDGHKPDRMDVHADAYRQYVPKLYDIVCEKIGRKPDPEVVPEFLRRVLAPTDFLSTAG